jgi:hypothetical protein
LVRPEAERRMRLEQALNAVAEVTPEMMIARVRGQQT